MSDPGRIARRLAFLARINANILEMAADSSLLCVAPRLLEEIARGGEEDREAQLARRIAETLGRRRLEAPAATPAMISRLDQIVEAGRELPDEAGGPVTERPWFEFPPPPVPGTQLIVPLLFRRLLIGEGRQQHNCVATLADRAARGTVAVYRVLAPERCTLSLVQRRGVRGIQQLKAACNREAEPATRRAVAEWLRGNRPRRAAPANPGAGRTNQSG